VIFVTVGTERFPFDRLTRAVDEWRDLLQGEPVFMQTGHGTYRPSCPYQDFLSFGEFRDKIRQARIVISHAGAGTLLMCVSLGKVPVMMARKSRFGEHVDDHQQMLAERMEERGLILLASDPGDIRECLLHYDERLRSRDRSRSVEPRLAHHLKAVLDDMSKAVVGVGPSR
jgi:UDP-N-acetylglucosamine transferase subunit ALG13